MESIWICTVVTIFRVFRDHEIMRRVFCLVSLKTCNAGFFEAIQNHNKEAVRSNSQLVSVQKTDKPFRKTLSMPFLAGIESKTQENRLFAANNH